MKLIDIRAAVDQMEIIQDQGKMFLNMIVKVVDDRSQEPAPDPDSFPPDC